MTPIEASILNFLRTRGHLTITGLVAAHCEVSAVHAAAAETSRKVIERVVLRMYMAGHLSREPHPVANYRDAVVYGHAGDCRWTAEQEIRLGLALQQQPEPVAA